MEPAELFPGATRVVPDPRLEEIHEALLKHFGVPKVREPWDPLTQLIYSMIASRTKTEDADGVMRELRRTYTSWEELRDASLGEVERAIAGVTFAEVKAPRVKAILMQITARVGELTLDFLAKYRTDKIREWLEQFEGVGPQVSAAVVNFSALRRRALCVDANHLRVAQRLGLTARADAGLTEERLMRVIPESWDAVKLDEHHALVKRLAQTVCTFAEPRCGECPLRTGCPYGTRQLEGRD